MLQEGIYFRTKYLPKKRYLPRHVGRKPKRSYCTLYSWQYNILYIILYDIQYYCNKLLFIIRTISRSSQTRALFENYNTFNVYLLLFYTSIEQYIPTYNAFSCFFLFLFLFCKPLHSLKWSVTHYYSFQCCYSNSIFFFVISRTRRGDCVSITSPRFTIIIRYLLLL